MATVFFGEFGNTNPTVKNFNDFERLILYQAVEEASVMIQLAYKHGLTNFKDFHYILEHCFGNSNPKTIKTIKEGLFKLNEICVDPKIYIKFIDAREQQHQRLTHIEKDLNDQYVFTFDDIYTKEKIMMANEKALGAYVNVQNMRDLNSKFAGHVGSVMNIYIGNGFLSNTTSIMTRKMVICHELTHKALLTVDYSFFEDKSIKNRDNPEERKILVDLIYGANQVKNIAKESPENAIRIADCWATFIAYIYVTIQDEPLSP